MKLHGGVAVAAEVPPTPDPSQVSVGILSSH